MRIPKIPRIPTMLLVTVMLAACASTQPAKQDGLELTVKTEPDELYLNLMPGPGAGTKPQPASVKLTLRVHNSSDQAFIAEAPTTQVVRFTVRRKDGQILYHSGDTAGMAITPVRIEPRSTATFPQGGETWQIDDLRQFKGETFTVSATFVPTRGQATVRLTVKEAH
jgi:hypothetical protein